MNTLEELIAGLEAKGILKTPAIKKAFQMVDRKNFVLPKHIDTAYLDRALPIGEKQTISQPLTVAFMLELLKPQKHHRILDVGSGSGWTTALLAELVGEKGKVFAIERIESLKKYGKAKVANMGYKNVEFTVGNGALGLPAHAPFDRILVSASTDQVPQKLVEQLAVGGRLVIPLRDEKGNILLLTKDGKKEISRLLYPGFAFVPLIH